jgi:hypothetical protein
VKYALTVSEATLAPDGTSKSMFVVNGQFPGPTLTASKFPIQIFFFFVFERLAYTFRLGRLSRDHSYQCNDNEWVSSQGRFPVLLGIKKY